MLNDATETERNVDIYDKFFADFDGSEFCELKQLKLHHQLIKYLLEDREINDPNYHPDQARVEQ